MKIKENILSIIAIILSFIALVFGIYNNISPGRIINSYRIFIGAEDEVAGYRLKDYREVLTIVTRIFKENNQGFTMTRADGSYIDDSGKFHGEQSYVIEINDITNAKFKKILEELKDNLNTGQIMVEEDEKKVYLYPDKIEYEAEPEN